MRKILEFLIYLWEKYITQNYKLKKFLKASSFQIVKIKNTSIILGCLNIGKGSDGKKVLVDKEGNVYHRNLSDAETSRKIRQYINNAKSQKKTIDDYAEDLFQFNKSIRTGRYRTRTGKIVTGEFQRWVKFELTGDLPQKLYGGSTILLNKESTVGIIGVLDDSMLVKQVATRIKGVINRGINDKFHLTDNVGGLDILQTSEWGNIQEKFAHLLKIDREEFWYKVNEEFWKKANKPWLEEIVKRGDDVRLVSDPSLETSRYIYLPKEKRFATYRGKRIQKIFNKEVEFLEKLNGYEIQGAVARKIKK
jgi:hypothetical protein